ncbi:MAG: ferric reductase-like transmembrane domain-containing protein [Firmicutes bacterium]|nr:ferric reductase-like transmembrane domain-containing protein [Bacillota bacterium]
MTSTVTWDIVRASGFVAYALVTLSVAFGLFMSLKVQSKRRWPRLINYELHQYTLLLAAFFTVVHGVSAWIDPFMRFHWYEVLVPFMSHYRPVWIAWGIIAFYLGLLLGLSTWLRPRLGYRTWRILHYLSYAVFILATIHGLGTGSDTKTAWALAVYGASAGLVALLTLWRLAAALRTRPGVQALVAGTILLTLAAGLGWTLKGPLAPDWSRVANNGHGSGARIKLVVVRPQTLLPLDGVSVSGALTTAEDANGQVAVNLQGRVAGAHGGLLLVQLKGQLTLGGNVLVEGGRAAWEPNHSANYWLARRVTYTNDTVRATLSSPLTHQKLSMILTLNTVNGSNFGAVLTLKPSRASVTA